MNGFHSAAHFRTRKIRGRAVGFALRSGEARAARDDGFEPDPDWTEGRVRIEETVRGSCRNSTKGLGAPRRIRTYDPRIRSPMLYPAELGARRNAIQVRGARPVKRNSLAPLPLPQFPSGRQRSAGQVEPTHPGGLAALDCAARNLA